MTKRLKEAIRGTLKDERKRRRVMENAQVVFVGVMWVLIVVLMCELSARVERTAPPNVPPNRKPPARRLGPEVPPRKALFGKRGHGTDFVTVAVGAGQVA